MVMNHEDTKTQSQKLPDETERIVTEIVDAAFQVHKALGPGLLESVYQACMSREFSRRGIEVEREVSIPVVYDGLRLESGLKLDFLVAQEIVLELKAVDVMLPVHNAQVLSYMRLANKRIGLLINFHVPLIRDGIKRFVL